MVLHVRSAAVIGLGDGSAVMVCARGWRLASAVRRLAACVTGMCWMGICMGRVGHLQARQAATWTACMMCRSCRTPAVWQAPSPRRVKMTSTELLTSHDALAWMNLIPLFSACTKRPVMPCRTVRLWQCATSPP